MKISVLIVMHSHQLLLSNLMENSIPIVDLPFYSTSLHFKNYFGKFYILFCIILNIKFIVLQLIASLVLLSAIPTIHELS